MPSADSRTLKAAGEPALESMRAWCNRTTQSESDSTMPIKILFLGDFEHPNASSWIRAMENYGDVEIQSWALPDPQTSIKPLIRGLSLLTATAMIRRRISQFNPDIILAYRTTSYGFLGASTGFRPLVLAAQGETDVWPPNRPSTPVKEWMARFAVSRADLLHAWGPHMARTLLKQGAESDAVVVCPRGVNLETFQPSAEGPSDDCLNITVTRSLGPDYCHSMILDAVRQLELDVPIKLHIVGDGELRKDLEQKTTKLGMENQVIFHGRKRPREVAQLLQQSQIYVSVPISEGVSASLFEAMACGCTPIVTDLEPNRAWVDHGTSGLLVPLHSAHALSQAISEVWNNKALRSQARKINISRAREGASIRTNVQGFLSRYESLIGKSKD